MGHVKSWSYTRLTEYENCPHRYKLNLDKQLPFVETIEMKDGNLQHKQLEDRVRDGKPMTDPRLQKMEPFCEKLDRMREKGATILAETELVFSANFEERSWFAKDAWFRAKVDVGAIQGSHAFLGDYKTGKRRPDNDQLKLFAAAAFTKWPELETIKTGFVWLKVNKVDGDVFHREQSPTIWEEFLGRLERIENSHQKNSWPCRPSGLCGWCPATKSQCDFSKN